MCISCDERVSVEIDECCPRCLVPFRVDVAVGTRRLGDYLASWAAFQDWCDERELAAAA
ncbi:MAG TPA: hypothetical protein VNI55_01110 [Gaiellaceae bacterium]|nr:hypothetical protein [Gaiellaceae bacterium]